MNIPHGWSIEKTVEEFYWQVDGHIAYMEADMRCVDLRIESIKSGENRLSTPYFSQLHENMMPKEENLYDLDSLTEYKSVLTREAEKSRIAQRHIKAFIERQNYLGAIDLENDPYE
uniref:Uncharacterized protein n=1 Tax=Pithovirus LCPAC304 TaxID=2506594 RepID=A0A481Z7X9_9VIRU|nr:MAG: hypothetical protein LCPAC304_02060 [Pithovirus LCPAC304]